MSLEPLNPSHVCNSNADRFANICTNQSERNLFAMNGSLHAQVINAAPASVQSVLHQSVSDNTKRAYRADMAHYAATQRHVPTTPESLAEYLVEMAGQYAVATIHRRLISVSKAHRALGFDDPAKSELVKATMKGIRRNYGVKQRQAKALLRDDLFAILSKLGNRPKDIRDRALLLLGFTTAMRRSELASLECSDLEFVSKGLLVHLRHSKTDQEGQGRMIAVPYGRSRHCAVQAVQTWISLAAIHEGALFRSMDKHGHISNQRISGEAVCYVVKSRITEAGYDPANFSGHSLRAGFATSAAQAGASSYKIRQTTGHKSEASLNRYIRDTDLFHDAAISHVL